MPQPTFDVFLSQIREEDVFNFQATQNLDMNLYEILEFKVENVGALPTAGNKGRLVYLITNDNIYLDTG